MKRKVSAFTSTDSNHENPVRTCVETCPRVRTLHISTEMSTDWRCLRACESTMYVYVWKCLDVHAYVSICWTRRRKEKRQNDEEECAKLKT